MPFLRIRINTAIMLHSTRYDLTKEILSNARVFIKDPILARTIDLDVVPVFMSAEIIDMKEFSPIWVYTKKDRWRFTIKIQTCSNTYVVI
ncbi:MAG: hypothetical protein IPO92_23215 [Saprospiraceae bacterium]|nr:hypothetical protein [Saprospiraceae bacterium]